MNSSIPIVDFSPLSLLVNDDQLDQLTVQLTADEIVKAFETIGFVYLSNTGIPKQLVL